MRATGHRRAARLMRDAGADAERVATHLLAGGGGSGPRHRRDPARGGIACGGTRCPGRGGALPPRAPPGRRRARRRPALRAGVQRDPRPRARGAGPRARRRSPRRGTPASAAGSRSSSEWHSSTRASTTTRRPPSPPRSKTCPRIWRWPGLCGRAARRPAAWATRTDLPRCSIRSSSAPSWASRTRPSAYSSGTLRWRRRWPAGRSTTHGGSAGPRSSGGRWTPGAPAR